MQIAYKLTGIVEVPDDWEVTPRALIRPDGTKIKLWECWELIDEDKDLYANLNHHQLDEMGLYSDGDMVEFKELH